MDESLYSVKEILKEKLKYQYEITVSNKYFQEQLNDEIIRIAKTTKLPGFRIGQVPIEIVKKNYLNETIINVIKKIVKKVSDSFIEKNFSTKQIVASDVEVCSCPDSSEDKKNNDLIYKLSFELMSDIPLLNIDNFILTEREVKIEESDINEFIEQLKATNKIFIDADSDEHIIQSGDKVFIDYQGKINNKIFKGGSAKNISLIIGSGNFLKDFEHQLIGMRKCESKTFTLKFPDNYKSSHLAGKETEMTVKVNNIMIAKVASDNEELAQSIGFKTFSELLNFAEKKIREQYNNLNSNLMKKHLFDQIDQNIVFDLPEEIVQKEEEKIENELKGLSEKNEVNISKEAIRRVKLGMLLMRVAEEHKISVNNQDILDFISTQYLNRGIPVDGILQSLKTNSNLVNHIKGKILENKVIDYIINNIKKEKEIISIKDLQALSVNV